MTTTAAQTSTFIGLRTRTLLTMAVESWIAAYPATIDAAA